MILMRETTEAVILRLTVAAGVSTPSTRYITRVSPSSGLMWMSEAPCWVAWATIECTSLITGAWSSASARRRSSALISSSSSTMSSIDSSMLGELGQQQVEVLDRGGARAHAPAGHHPDVVDREDVGGVGHRDQHGAVLGEADRHRLVAAGGGGADEVDRAHVEVEGWSGRRSPGRSARPPRGRAGRGAGSRVRPGSGRSGGPARGRPGRRPRRSRGRTARGPRRPRRSCARSDPGGGAGRAPCWGSGWARAGGRRPAPRRAPPAGARRWAWRSLPSLLISARPRWLLTACRATFARGTWRSANAP